MTSIGASKTAWFVVSALACALASVAACSSSDDDRSGAGAGGSTSGGAGAGAGGASGAATAGSGGASAGAANSGPFECSKSTPKANCDSWTSFSQATTSSWGSGIFQGGVTTFGAKLVRDGATDSIHVTGTVDDYGYGVGLFFLNCADLSGYTGVSFKLSGSAGTTDTMIFQVQTNDDYPWQAKPTDRKGACTALDMANPFGSCVAPSKTIPLADGSVLFADLAGGMPEATASANQALGLQWAFPYDGKTSYAFDVTISDVQLLGGSGVSCNGAGGSGGSGGSSAGGSPGEAGAAGSN